MARGDSTGHQQILSRLEAKALSSISLSDAIALAAPPTVDSRRWVSPFLQTS
jgi:hypothetical protein